MVSSGVGWSIPIGPVRPSHSDSDSLITHAPGGSGRPSMHALNAHLVLMPSLSNTPINGAHTCLQNSPCFPSPSPSIYLPPPNPASPSLPHNLHCCVLPSSSLTKHLLLRCGCWLPRGGVLDGR
ncbi:hypothetical protein VPH35_076145 [Triticum aestivum]|uniref:Uncharacterized protein n=1 Tax=Aegilops tauschii subsp. strangulata TaxID=200361 RepID=A0A453H188_AEGTS